MSNCPCGSDKSLEECCGPIISGEIKAPTAEALMRSRYTAYVVKDLEYLKKTLTVESRKSYDEEGARTWADTANWLGLEIVSTDKGGENDDYGEVIFAARFEQGGMRQEHRELSRFEREEGEWRYNDGDMVASPPIKRGPKIGRNEPCPCGSGKKYKKCCAD